MSLLLLLAHSFFFMKRTRRPRADEGFASTEAFLDMECHASEGSRHDHAARVDCRCAFPLLRVRVVNLWETFLVFSLVNFGITSSQPRT